jgi:hypothetical protein
MSRQGVEVAALTHTTPAIHLTDLPVDLEVDLEVAPEAPAGLPHIIPPAAILTLDMRRPAAILTQVATLVAHTDIATATLTTIVTMHLLPPLRS